MDTTYLHLFHGWGENLLYIMGFEIDTVNAQSYEEDQKNQN